MKSNFSAIARFLLIFSFIGVFAIDYECNPRYFDSDSFVCVCDTNYCDFIGTYDPPAPGTYALLSSSNDSLRFNWTYGQVGNTTVNATAIIFVNNSEVRQPMIGFGGSFTDSTGINIAALSEKNQEVLLRSYFSTEGLEYAIARIPIAGTDFSVRPYSYCDVENDTELENFGLVYEDYNFKLPYIRRAMGMNNNRDMRFFSAPWSPPSWMKTNGMFNGSGGLLDGMEQPWADYFVKFIDAYTHEGIPLWGLSPQNEPTMGQQDYAWNACYYTPEEMRDFIRDYLGPTLQRNGMRYLKMMCTDDSRQSLPEYPETILNDTEAEQYVDGIAMHWYADIFPNSVSRIDDIHNLYPDKFFLYTEACSGFLFGEWNEVRLGSWTRAQMYASDIIENVNHWSSGWTDWNMALDMQGGPNWAFNYVDSPIIVNEEDDEFYKQPMFYAMGHFSKFIYEGAYALETLVQAFEKVKVEATSFIDTNNHNVVVLLNKEDEEIDIEVRDPHGNAIPLLLPSKSLHTLIYDAISK